MTFMKMLLVGTFVCLGIFLFATAPSELPDIDPESIDQTEVDVSRLFNTVNALNEAARTVYTKRIVGVGKSAGLKFGEDWNEPGVHKGPLPALFLRLVSRQLERRPEPLGLYLGSDEPINKSNLFSPEQMAQFLKVKDTHKPQFSASESSRSIAMYPDFASVKPCAQCHNEHSDSPKTDWKVGDIMGATTWTYPDATISETTLLMTSRALYMSLSEAYGSYLVKSESFVEPVTIGKNWPAEGRRALPDVETFMAAVLKEAGATVALQVLTSNE